jgi:hypothetical protein
MEYNYPIHFQIQYSNDDEYRECLIQVFHYDDTNDNSDDSYSSKLLDVLFEKTSVHLRELYELSSAIMMTENLDIGLAILFSYDYFSLFHLCLCDYFAINQEEQIQFSKRNQYYLQLVDKFRKTKEEPTNEEVSDMSDIVSDEDQSV